MHEQFKIVNIYNTEVYMETQRSCTDYIRFKTLSPKEWIQNVALYLELRDLSNKRLTQVI